MWGVIVVDEQERARVAENDEQGGYRAEDIDRPVVGRNQDLWGP